MEELLRLFGNEPFTATDLYNAAKTDSQLWLRLARALGRHEWDLNLDPASLGRYLGILVLRNKGQLWRYVKKGRTQYRIWPPASEKPHSAGINSPLEPKTARAW
jgi:hypothetical protein